MAAVETAIPYAKATKCKLIHAMAGLWPEGRDKLEALPTYVDNLRWAADRLAREGVTAIVEPINTRDIPGYYLNTTAQAMPIIEAVDGPICGCSRTSTTCRSCAATWRRRSASSPAATRTSRSPAGPAATSGVSEMNYPFLRSARRDRL